MTDKPMYIEYWIDQKLYASRRRTAGVPLEGQEVILSRTPFKVVRVVWHESDTDTLSSAACVRVAVVLEKIKE